jgi:hypothetical protein
VNTAVIPVRKAAFHLLLDHRQGQYYVILMEDIITGILMDAPTGVVMITGFILTGNM